MKKLLFISAIACASLVACKKDHTCTCTTSASGYTGAADVTTYPKSTKAAARAHCLSSTQTQSGVVYTTTCTLN